jgi:F-type H+-transporting ATPase subunit gamma
LNNLVKSAGDLPSPFLKENNQTVKVLCVITSDSGLCGVYNNNVLRSAEEFIHLHGKDAVKLVCIGRKGLNYFKKRDIEILQTYLGMNGRFSEQVSNEITRFLIDLFLRQSAGEVHILYTYFGGGLSHRPVREKFLSLSLGTGKEIEYILEPDALSILAELIPRFLAMRLRLALLESFTSEHAARSVAMKSATDNAKDLLQNLILQRNKVRQANITRDMLEIISSAEALKG